jgi:subtilisin family serine protease
MSDKPTAYPIVTVDDHRIVEVFTNEIGTQEYRDWAIEHAGIASVNRQYKGDGQRVGVLDTGCDIHHQDLEGRVIAKNFIKGCRQRPAYQDNNGHGTFCTGEIVAKADGRGVVGVAPHAKAFHARILYGDRRDASRDSINADIANAVRACVDEGCGVISMSIGGPGADVYTRDALEYAVNSGVIPIAAAGNERLEGSPYASYPASYPTVISVASSDKNDMPAWFSTIGRSSKPKSGQPEVAVSSLEYYYGCIPGRTMYGTMIGTSMATPIVAGVALLWRQAMESKDKMPEGKNVLATFRKWLRTVANDTNKNGWDPELGFGVLLLEDGEL